jgi:penicillin-binding protein 1A
VLATGAALATYWTIRHYEADLPGIGDLRGNYHPPQVTRVLARDGTLLAELFVERRTVVPIASLPAHVKLALLAAEDARFYEHKGLNYLGIARAMLVNLRSGRARQGGSTITQQVVKNLLLDSERTFRRKAREALLARRLEQELSKDDILELYLNHIYFGHGRYGIEEAARDYFGRSAKELSIAEAALLAGIVAGPESYSPRRDLKKALSRRAYVLGQMREQGFIKGQQQYEDAMNEPVLLAPVQTAVNELAPEAVEIARRMLATIEPERAKLGGFTVTTSIDPKMQAAARKALREGLLGYDKRHGLNGGLRLPPAPKKPRGKAKAQVESPRLFSGTPDFDHHKVMLGSVVDADDNAGTFDVRVGTAVGTVKLTDYERYNPGKLTASKFAPTGASVRVSLLAPLAQSADKVQTTTKVPLRLESGPEGAMVALDVRTRQVLALVGNYEAVSGGLDRATQSRRQPGSTFKPIVYSYALHARRVTPATLIDVSPEAFDGNYRPTNFEGWQGTEAIRLRDAVANSVNVVAVRVLRDVGPANVVQWAQSLGFTSTLKPDLSLALGSYEVTPIELAGAYATFAAGGIYSEARVVTKVVGPDGKAVALPAAPPSRQVLDEAEAYITTSLLTSVVEYGTGARARSLGRPVAGKTGTSNQAKDTWFAGYSPEIAAVVWVGYDDGKPLGGAEMGAATALPIWVNFMKVAHEGRPRSEFSRPAAGLTTLKVDRKTGLIPYDGDTDTYDEVFLAGSEPIDVAPLPVSDAGVDAGVEAAAPPQPAVPQSDGSAP